MLTDWLLAAGIFAKGADNFSRTYQNVVWEEKNKEKLDLLDEIGLPFRMFCGSPNYDPYLTIMKYNECDHSKKTFETIRLLYEFSKVSPVMWKKLNGGQRYYGDPYMERQFYGEMTTNQYIECNPETMRLGYGDDILRMDDEMMTTLDVLQEQGYGHGIVRTFSMPKEPRSQWGDWIYRRTVSWCPLALCMDRKLKYAIRNAFAPCPQIKFFTEYFNIASNDVYYSDIDSYKVPSGIYDDDFTVPTNVPIKNIYL